MRTSNREKILRAAVEVIENDGLTALTFDTVAAAAGITRSGIIYHFSSREGLVRAVADHVRRRWEADLQRALGELSFDEANERQRLAAYIRAGAGSDSRAELQLALETGLAPGAWADVVERWAPDPEGADARAAARLVARFAADGMWLNDATGSAALTDTQRRVVTDLMLTMLDDPE